VSVSLFLVLLALAVSTASAVMTWSVLQRDRERSAARVAALGAAIEPLPEVRFNDAYLDASPSPLFAVAEPPTRDTTRLRLAVIGVMALIAVVALGAQYRAAHHQTAAVASAAVTSPLELMSMRHVREGDTFTVRGLVRNPSRSRPVSGLSAVVFAFDRNGTFVTSARAPIDFTTLQPGDESPFAVTIPTPGDIAKYRVAFRTDAGVLRHVDRRESGVNLAVNRQ
jgi:hypothetical protein